MLIQFLFFLAETDFELESVSDDEEDDLDYLDDLERNGSESNLSVKRSLSDSGAKGLPAGGSSRTLREVITVLVRLQKKISLNQILSFIASGKCQRRYYGRFPRSWKSSREGYQRSGRCYWRISGSSSEAYSWFERGRGNLCAYVSNRYFIF
jgi:hypothetical protein